MQKRNLLPITMKNFTISKTQRGKEAIYHEGYIYTINFIRNDGRKNFRCSDRGCGVRLTLDMLLLNIEEIKGTHNHDEPEKNKN